MVQNASSGSTSRCGRASIPGATQERPSATAITAGSMPSQRSSQAPIKSAVRPMARPTSSITAPQPPAR